MAGDPRVFSAAEEETERWRQFLVSMRSEIEDLRRQRDQALLAKDAALAEAAQLRLLALERLPEIAEALRAQRKQAWDWAAMMPRGR